MILEFWFQDLGFRAEDSRFRYLRCAPTVSKASVLTLTVAGSSLKVMSTSQEEPGGHCDQGWSLGLRDKG